MRTTSKLFWMFDRMISPVEEVPVSYSAEILSDAISPAGVRLTTFLVRHPRFILAEINTHRMLAKNGASSRAIPVRKRIASIEADPFIPEEFGRNQRGMQATTILEGLAVEQALDIWKDACRDSIKSAKALAEIEVHKQIANRLLEPFAWQTTILSATSWANFYNRRCHRDVQPEFRIIAELMLDLHRRSIPIHVPAGWWSMPLVSEEEHPTTDRTYYTGVYRSADNPIDWRKISAARCARVSYLTHEGLRDLDEDLKLYERLVSSGHLSPLEHVACAMVSRTPPAGGPFFGWDQLRKGIMNEDCLPQEDGQFVWVDRRYAWEDPSKPRPCSE